MSRRHFDFEKRCRQGILSQEKIPHVGRRRQPVCHKHRRIAAAYRSRNIFVDGFCAFSNSHTCIKGHMTLL